MAKYKAEVGGFVTVFRKRSVTVYAESESEAKEKAIDKFVALQQKGANVCEEGTVDFIKRID